VSLEKVTNPFSARHWLGDMEADYIYTLGVAGERFFNELKRGKITGAKCRRCGVVYVPPRMYCERCFEKLEEWVEVGKKGVVHTFTIATIDLDGKELDKPVIYALIKFNGVHGGIIHEIGETDTVFIGMKVEAVLKPPRQRKASINDIAYFKPAK
jgi:hypothetical protein